MSRFFEIFRLELRALVRSKALALLALFAVAWCLVLPHLVKSDGTAAGEREILVRYALGVVFAVTLVALMGSATGSLARERAERRLQLTLVRPVRYFTVALAKTAALTAAGALVLALSAFSLALRLGVSRSCSHFLSPVLESPAQEVERMYRVYMEDPETPDEVKKAPKATVLRILRQRAVDHYQGVETNATETWTFPALRTDTPPGVRLRFTNSFEMRQDVRGEFRLGELSAAVSNVTQAVLTVPLGGGAIPSAEGPWQLTFSNRGQSALMLRPRKDLKLLVRADAFGCNLVRAWLELLAVLGFAVAFSVLLSAALSRPVAAFVAAVTLLVTVMSPSVLEQYPDSLERDRIDRLGLAVTRLAARMTRPMSDLRPLEALATDECVEWPEVLGALGWNLAAFPVLFCLLAALAMPVKQD